MKTRRTYVVVGGLYIRETPEAYKVKIGLRDAYFPKSVSILREDDLGFYLECEEEFYLKKVREEADVKYNVSDAKAKPRRRRRSRKYER